MENDNLNGSKAFSEQQLVTFYLDNSEFAVNIMRVREIIRYTGVTKVPKAPAYLDGVSNLRGSLLPVIDGRLLFGMDRKAHDESTRVVVLDIHGVDTGIVVDRVMEVLRVQTNVIEKPPAVCDVETEYLEGVVKLDGGQRLIMILNLDLLLVHGLDAVNENSLHSVIAETEAGEVNIIDEDQLVTFLVGNEEYAFDIMNVKEIIRVPEITAVPDTMQYVEGLVSIRNQLIPIINMRVYFDMPEVTKDDQARVIIVDLGKLRTGFRVDRVREVIHVLRSTIEPTPTFLGKDGAEKIRGVAKLNNGSRLLMCLDINNLLPDEMIQKLSEIDAEAEIEKKEGQNVLDEEQLVAFRLGSDEYAINVNEVQEINRMTEAIRMPGAPRYIEGLVNLRGNIIPALSLRNRFSLPERQKDDSTRIIIVDFNEKKTGIIVDAVTEVLRFEKGLIENTPGILEQSVEADLIGGVAKLNEGKRMVMILNLSSVLNYDKEIEVKIQSDKKGAAAKSSKSKEMSKETTKKIIKEAPRKAPEEIQNPE
ncbi:MAG: chemotaxis protein CheW [Thermacetogeniaceae bacterium]